MFRVFISFGEDVVYSFINKSGQINYLFVYDLHALLISTPLTV